MPVGILLALSLTLSPLASAAVRVAPAAAPVPAVDAAGLLSAVSLRYGTDPGLQTVADLGEGDYGQVRSGRMPDPLPALAGLLPAAPGEPVAVKIPYLDPGGMSAHEAEVSRRLAQAGGSQVFVRAAHDPELGVVVMEKLDGYVPVNEWAEARGAIGKRTFARIERQLKSALSALEAAGLVHSDLKPDNVLIGPRGRVKIVDFGITADEGGYPPYPDYEGWRGGHLDYVSENQLHNGPAAFADDRHSAAVLLSRLRRFVR